MRVFPLTSAPPKPLVRFGRRSSHHHGGRRRTLRTLATLPILLLLLLAGASAALAAPATVIGTGLTEPGGAIVAPDGHVWVSDGGSGFCATTATDPPSGAIGTLTAVCDATVTGQPAATPDGTLVLIPDGARGSTIHRLRWDPALGSYFPDGEIAVDHPLPGGVSIGPDGAAYVFFTRQANVERIPAATTASPGAAQEIGTVAGGARGAAAIAAGLDATGLRTAVYLAENKAGGVSELVQPTGPADVAAPTLFGAATLGATPPAFNALVYDPAAHTLFAATALGLANAFPDVLASMDVLNPHVQDDAVATGYGNVGGLGLGAAGSGRILATDDPSSVGTAGAGRLLATGVPDTAAPITTIDTPLEGATTSASPSIAFRANEAASFACRLDTGAFAPCSSPVTFNGLAAGGHTVDVQATDTAGNVGAIVSRHFTVRVPAAVPAGTPATPAGRVPGAGGAAGGVLGTVVDRTAPRLTLSLAGGRVRLVGNRISLPVRCSETCAATASGTISVRGSARRVEVAGATKVVQTGRTVRLVVRVPRRALGSIRRALRAHRVVTLRLSLRAEDLAGNVRTGTRAVRLVR